MGNYASDFWLENSPSYTSYLNGVPQGGRVKGYFLLHTVDNLQCRTGSPYIKGKLMDNTGSMDFVCFDYRGDLHKTDAGSIVYVDGKMDSYKGSPQLVLSDVRRAGPSDVGHYDMRDMLTYAKYHGKEALDQVREFINTWLDDGDYQRLCTAMVDANAQVFSTCPASMDNHHACVGGLITHSLETAKQALMTADYYRDEYGYQFDEDLLGAGALLHDIGKVSEYCCDKSGLAIQPVKSSKTGNHVLEGAMMVQRTAEDLSIPNDKLDKLFNMILSHHSSPRFSVGSQPQTREAQLLAIIDNMDSCINGEYGKRITYRNGKPTRAGPPKVSQ